MHTHGWIASVTALLAATALGAPAADKTPPKAPAAASAPATRAAAPAPAELEATVVSVTGPAQKLAAGKGERKWQPIKAGDKLGPLTVVRTGLGAKVVLKFADRGEVIVNNATKIGIGELRRQGQKVSADVGLKYGTIRASVEAERGQSNFRISTPVATLSVRGSTADVAAMGDSPNVINVTTGLWPLLRKLALAEGDEGAAELIAQSGEMAGTSGDMPIVLALKLRAALLFDAFGVTTSEQKSLIQNYAGVQSGNTPSGGSSGSPIVPSNVVPTPPSPPWPPYP